MKTKTIRNRIIKTELLEWRKLEWLQSSGLKDISREAFQKLKNSITENDFIDAFNVWQDGEKVWILDGHHRQHAMEELEEEGTKIPDLLSANFIDCKNRKEAIKLVLVYSAIYAKVTPQGLFDMMETEGLEMAELENEIELPEIDWSKFSKGYDEDVKEIEEEIKPYKKTHVLLSFPPGKLARIEKHLKAILKVEGVEYDQGSN